MISLQATTPGTDPLVAVKQVGEQNNRMSALLLNILSHMKMVLLNDYSTSMSMSDAFSTGTQREAARLCCEALLQSIKEWGTCRQLQITRKRSWHGSWKRGKDQYQGRPEPRLRLLVSVSQFSSRVSSQLSGWSVSTISTSRGRGRSRAAGRCAVHCDGGSGRGPHFAESEPGSES